MAARRRMAATAVAWSGTSAATAIAASTASISTAAVRALGYDGLPHVQRWPRPSVATTSLRTIAT
jgi:hypothetical protein